MSKRRQDSRERRRAGKRHRGVPLGNGMSMAAPDEVLRALGRLPADLDWGTVAPNVFPVLARRRPLPPEIGEPLRVLLPPGIMTGFGIDIGPAVLHVGPDLLATWGLEPAELTARALENLRRRTARARPRDVREETIDGVPVRLLQSGWGWASTLLLVEDELIRLFGDGPQRFIAPMRDLLVSIPASVPGEFAGWLNDELTDLDPNALALDAFVLDGGQLRYETLAGREVRA